MHFQNASAPERSYAYVHGTVTRSVSGDWSDTAGTLRYANSRSGWYLVFQESGSLYRLDAPARMTELDHTLAPMRELEIRQQALAAGQKSLANQRKVLAAEQQSANTPGEMAQVGAVQGAIGQEQGEIGRLQGELGRQQGEIGRAFNLRAKEMIDACLRDGSCKRVSTDAAQR